MNFMQTFILPDLIFLFWMFEGKLFYSFKIWMIKYENVWKMNILVGYDYYLSNGNFTVPSITMILKMLQPYHSIKFYLILTQEAYSTVGMCVIITLFRRDGDEWKKNSFVRALCQQLISIADKRWRNIRLCVFEYPNNFEQHY